MQDDLGLLAERHSKIQRALMRRVSFLPANEAIAARENHALVRTCLADGAEFLFEWRHGFRSRDLFHCAVQVSTYARGHHAQVARIAALSLGHRRGVVTVADDGRAAQGAGGRRRTVAGKRRHYRCAGDE